MKWPSFSINRSRLPQNPLAPALSRFPAAPATEKAAPAEPLKIHTTSLGFNGATLTDTGAFPPDSMGTVGPAQFITFVNGRLRSFTKAGVGGSINLNFELVKNFRIFTNNYYSDGGGRYIFGQAPDLIVRADGSLSPIHSGSTLTGAEVTAGQTLIYSYYGGVYIQRNTALDANGTTRIGYGFIGSGGGQNRTIQQFTFGTNTTLWRDARYGALNLMFQYSYLQRNPWSVATGQPSDAHTHIGFMNLRYTLPGSAPAVR